MLHHWPAQGADKAWIYVWVHYRKASTCLTLTFWECYPRKEIECGGTQGRIAVYWTRYTVQGYAKSRGRVACSAQFLFVPQKMKSSVPRGPYQKNPISFSVLKFMKSREYKSVQIMKKSFIFYSFYIFLNYLVFLGYFHYSILNWLSSYKWYSLAILPAFRISF